VLQCVAVFFLVHQLCAWVVQCVAVCCSVLQRGGASKQLLVYHLRVRVKYCVAECCSVLQYEAVCCSMLQYVAVLCSVALC